MSRCVGWMIMPGPLFTMRSAPSSYTMERGISAGTMSDASSHSQTMRSPAETGMRALCTSSPFTVTRPFHFTRFHSEADRRPLCRTKLRSITGGGPSGTIHSSLMSPSFLLPIISGSVRFFKTGKQKQHLLRDAV